MFVTESLKRKDYSFKKIDELRQLCTINNIKFDKRTTKKSIVTLLGKNIGRYQRDAFETIQTMTRQEIEHGCEKHKILYTSKIESIVLLNRKRYMGNIYLLLLAHKNGELSIVLDVFKIIIMMILSYESMEELKYVLEAIRYDLEYSKLINFTVNFVSKFYSFPSVRETTVLNGNYLILTENYRFPHYNYRGYIEISPGTLVIATLSNQKDQFETLIETPEYKIFKQ